MVLFLGDCVLFIIKELLMTGCGMKLRGDDPVGMKSFIHSIQSRVNELKASSESGQSNMNNKRVCILKIINTEFVICASYFLLLLSISSDGVYA